MLYLKATAVGIMTGVAVPILVALLLLLLAFVYSLTSGHIVFDFAFIPSKVIALFSVNFAMGFAGTLWRAHAQGRKAI